MSKIGEHLTVRTDEEIEAKKAKDSRLTFAIIAAVLFFIIVIAIVESSPESRQAQREQQAKEERRRRVEAETERTHQLFKEAEELQKKRPLNAVEERVIKDHARQAAEQRVPR